MKIDHIVINFEQPSSTIRSGLNVYSDEAVKRKHPFVRFKNSFDRLLHYFTNFSLSRTDTDCLARKDIVLWRKPITTLIFFFKEICFLLNQYYIKYRYNQRVQKEVSAGVILLMVLVFLMYNFDGPHQLIMKYIYWCSYWIFLGILSSVGLGTGLHTFILYLAPHIATVTIAAYECHSLNFPEPPYPDRVLCPEMPFVEEIDISIWRIMRKVQLESFSWGAGTAIGELPPYFLARAARLSSRHTFISDNGNDYNSMELQEEGDYKSFKFLVNGKYIIEQFVKKVGFFGIMACASIPNPLFDLAGLTCGHFLVPFWKFFGATLIGKAVIKVTIQEIFIIVVFNEKLLQKLVHFFEIIPSVGALFKKTVENFLSDQKERFHNKSAVFENFHRVSILSLLFEVVTSVMIIYFVLSIMNSSAQAYYDRIQGKSKHIKV